MPSPTAWNLYLNFGILAITGRLAEADSIMREHSLAIRSVARRLRKDIPVTIRPLYRGLLVEPERVKEGKLRLIDPAHTFASFSEDRDVACYFADPEVYLAGPLIAIRPQARGWIMVYKPFAADILFHWKWRKHPRYPVPLEVACRHHPQVEPDQFLWNLATQKEVLVTAPSELVPVEPYTTGPPTHVLEERFLPPSIRRAQ